ncbi:MAG TPA: chalcone isomerase family protein [Burkholderiaceae bacterium]|nr:chalcone isomerase family protein [Burkholderiaceae bacterium]
MIRRALIALVTTAASLALPLTAAAQGATTGSAPAAAAAGTTEVGGVKFDNSIQLGGARLQLNGAGVRYKAIFKVYAAGLYLSAKATNTEAVLATPGPRLIKIVMLREIDANELGKLFTKGMEQNAPREEFSKSIGGIMQMSEIFSSRKNLKAGEWFGVEWVPGTGTVIVVNGQPTGQPIKEPEFYSALMKIWLGKAPADAGLKEALLGKAATVPGSNAGYNSN